jgi:hypothetical protein
MVQDAFDVAGTDNFDLRQWYTDVGQAFRQNTHLGTLILDPFVAISDPIAQFLLATGIRASAVHTLDVRCSNPFWVVDAYNYNNQPWMRDGRFARSDRQCAGLISDILIDNTSLTKLELCSAELGEREMTVLSLGLAGNANLTYLELKRCFIGDGNVGLMILFRQGLAGNTSLTHLSLEGCEVNDVGIQGLVEHWPPESPIQSLRLPCNSIGSTGAQLLFQFAQQHPALQTLDMFGNGDIGYEALRNIGTELPNQPFLTNIDLFGCATLSPLDTTWSLAAYQALTDGLRNNLRIKEFNVDGNRLPSIRQYETDFYLSRNTMGGNLLLSRGNQLAASVWCYFLAKCQSQRRFGNSLVFLYLCEQPDLIAFPRILQEPATRNSDEL